MIAKVIQNLFGYEPQFACERWRVWVMLPVIMSVGALVGWLFYATLSAALVGLLLSGFALKMIVSDYKDRCNQRLLDEFSDLTLWLLAGFQSGRTLENTLINFLEEWKRDNHKNFNYMGPVLVLWEDRLLMGAKGTELFRSLAEVTKVEMISSFSHLLDNCLIHGGSAIEVIQRFNQYLREERLLAKEIEVVIAQKRMEHYLVSISPLGFLLYLQVTSKAFIAPLYDTAMGSVLMSFAAAIFIAMWLWGKRMIRCLG